MSMMQRYQRGMALIIVLMLFAILSTLAMEILFRQNRFLNRADNLLQWDKRHQYAMAAEVVAQQGLIDDLQDDIKNGAQLDDCVEETKKLSKLNIRNSSRSVNKC